MAECKYGPCAAAYRLPNDIFLCTVLTTALIYAKEHQRSITLLSKLLLPLPKQIATIVTSSCHHIVCQCRSHWHTLLSMPLPLAYPIVTSSCHHIVCQCHSHWHTLLSMLLPLFHLLMRFLFVYPIVISSCCHIVCQCHSHWHTPLPMPLPLAYPNARRLLLSRPIVTSFAIVTSYCHVVCYCHVPL